MWAWLKRTFAGSGCVPDASQQVTLTPPVSTQQQGSFASSTPLPLGYASKAGSIYSSSASQDTSAGPDTTPADPSAARAGRYIVTAKGIPVGIANTVSKYRESQPVRTHLTPFEQRVAAKLSEEQQVAAAAAAVAAGGAEADDAGSDVSSVGPQQLFGAAGTASRA